VYFKEINGDSQEFNLMCEIVSEAELAETSFLGEEEDAAGYKHIFDDGYDIYLVLAKPMVLTYSTLYLALGKAAPGMVLNLSRQGIFFIPVKKTPF